MPWCPHTHISLRALFPDPLWLPQVIDHYKQRVVNIKADKPQKEVAEQVRKALE